jgi:hypothetical protein
MRHCYLAALSATALLAAPVLAQIVIDGGRDAGYCDPIVVQNTQTQFGDSNLGQIGFANGSELDAAYARVSGGTLYLLLTGNLETNFNKLEIFIDSIAGEGQNRLRGDNPNVDFNGLNRMGDDGSNNGLTFDAGFAPDFWVSCTIGGGTPDIFVNYAQLLTNGGGEGYYMGQTTAGSDGTLNGGNNPNNIRLTIDNRNTAGVPGGNGTDPIGNPADVATGIEVAIPLAAIGNPAGNFAIAAMVNGGGHDFLSNQVLGGIGGGSNLAEPRNVNFANIPGDQFFTVDAAAALCGACCVGEVCSITTQAGCSGTYLGDNTNCAGNPCDVVATGACCVGNTCSQQTAAECATAGGYYFGDNVACTPLSCFSIGACCVGVACSIQTEADCGTAGGTWLGGGSSCANDPCAVGACCLNGVCQQLREEVCLDQDGIYLGDNTPCAGDVCVVGACCIGTHCAVVRPSECSALGGVYGGNNTACTPTSCGAPPGQPIMDGQADASYGSPLVTQDTSTGFGDSNLALVDQANGSELDVAYGQVLNGTLYLVLAGNLESNGNDLELFFDTRPGGQNRLLGTNPDVDFNGLNRMGDDGSGNGLTFDANFAADYYLTISNSRASSTRPVRVFVNFAELSTPGDPDGQGYFLGEGRAANQTQGGLLNRAPGNNNPFNALVTLDNSNILGVLGGFGIDTGAGVTTGVEICIPLSALGNPAGDIRVCAFVNGQQHDFVSNQVLGGIFGSVGGNIGEPRAANFENILFEQSFVVPNVNPCAGLLLGDSDGSGAVNNFDIDAFVLAISNPAVYTAQFCDNNPACTTCRNDLDHSGAVNNFDIDPFVACLNNLPPPGQGCP